MNSQFFVKYQLRNNYFSTKDLGYRKKLWPLFILLFFSFLLGSFSAQSKEMTSKYDLEMLGAKIGEFTVTQKNVNISHQIGHCITHK